MWIGRENSSDLAAAIFQSRYCMTAESNLNVDLDPDNVNKINEQ